MAMRPLYPVAILALLLLNGTAHAANSANIVANVVVLPVGGSCPFNLNLNMQAGYARVGNIIVNYTFNTQSSSCSVSNIKGNFMILTANNLIAFSENIVANSITSTLVTNSLSFNSTANLTNTSYTAKISLGDALESNTASSAFTLFNPANIVITSAAVQGAVYPGSLVTLAVNLQNMGQFASGNILLNVSEDAYNYNNNFPVAALSPTQNEIVVLTISGISGRIGANTGRVQAVYFANNARLQGAEVPFHYTVIGTGGGGGPSGFGQNITAITPVTQFAQLTLSSFPFLIATLSGTIYPSLIALNNTGASAEVISLTVPKQFSSVLSLSASNLLILPRQSLLVDLIFNPNKNATPQQDVIPVNISVSVVNGSTVTKNTEYIIYSVMNNSPANPRIINVLNLVNGSSVASGRIELKPAQNTGLNNATLYTYIPFGAAPNVSSIYAYGLPNNVSVQNGFYVIAWEVPEVPAGQSTFGYYSISRPMHPSLLYNIQNVLAAPSVPSPSDILSIVSISTPTIYANSSGSVTVSLLYTGTAIQPITLSMSSPPAITVFNSTRTINASPNQFINEVFRLKTGPNPGTDVMELSIFTNGANQTVAVPLVLLPTTPFVPPQNLVIQSSTFQRIAVAVVILAMLGFIYYRLNHYLRRSRYTPERVEKMIRIREQIRREEGEKNE